MLNVARAINATTGILVTHERDGADTYDADGYLVRGTPTSTQIRASIQPLSGREFENLPQGLRDEAQATIYTAHPLQSDDRIIDGEDRWKVLSDDSWQKLGGYTKAILGALR